MSLRRGSDVAAAQPTLKRRITFKIVRMRDIVSSEYLKVLFYGGPGVGKTLAAGGALSMPELGIVLWIGYESGEKTVSDHRDVEVAEINYYDQMWELIRALRSGSLEYDTIVLDGMESMYQKQLRRQLRTTEIRRFNDDVPAQQDYLVGTSRTRSLLDAFRNLKCNWICTTQVKTWMDGAGFFHIKPRMPGQLADEVAQYFDTVAYLYTKAQGRVVKYYAQFAPFGRIYAKHRSPGGRSNLPPTMDITDKKVLQTIYEASVLETELAEELRGESLSKLDEISGDAAPAAMIS